jgi:hypothetical protein
MSKAKLPGLPAPMFTDPALQRWAQAVTERLEVREGARGDKLERVVTLRDLQTPAVTLSGGRFGAESLGSPSTLAGFAKVDLGNGAFANINIEAFSEQLRGTRLYSDLMGSINNPDRFNALANEVKEVLLRSISAEAAARGAQIARNEILIQDTSRSVAAAITELTASVAETAAGVRFSQFAIATETSAVAGQVTQLEARLQVKVNPEDLLPVPPAAAYADFATLNTAIPAAAADTRKYYRVAGTPEQLYRSNGSTWNLVGSEDSAKLEQVLLVTADKSLGLEAQYTLKVTAGNAIAGFGLAATERDGVPDSAFIIQANRFALVAPYTFVQESTPTATAIGQTWYKPSTKIAYRATAVGTGSWAEYTPPVPFGVDAVTGTAFVSNSLRIGTGSGVEMTAVQSGITNFNAHNDRNGAAVLAPTILTNGDAVDHTVNTDGSVDLSFEWDWAGNNSDIDGWIVKVYTNANGAAYTFGTTPAAEAEFFLPPEKRALIGYGYPANVYYKFGVQAYRVVDPDVNAAGIIKSTLVVPSLAAENPYRPAANVAFAGNVTGTLNGTAVATVTTNAANGAIAYSEVFNSTTGLATKMGNAVKNTITGQGGIKVGTIDWSSDGTIITGAGTAMTAKGIFGRNSAGEITFSLSSTDGTALFGGNIDTSGQVYARGSTFDASAGNAAIIAIPGTSGVLGMYIQNSNSTGLLISTSNGRAVNALGGTSGLPAANFINGSGGPAVEANSLAAAVDITAGYIQRPYSTVGVIEVFDMSGVTQGIFRYEFRAAP